MLTAKAWCTRCIRPAESEGCVWVKIVRFMIATVLATATQPQPRLHSHSLLGPTANNRLLGCLSYHLADGRFYCLLMDNSATYVKPAAAAAAAAAFSRFPSFDAVECALFTDSGAQRLCVCVLSDRRL